MRILFLDTRPLRRGAQIFISDLSNELIRRGHDVKKVYLYEIKESGRLDLNSADEVLGGNDAHIFEKIPTIHPGLLKKLVHVINAFDPDILLLNGSRNLKYGSAAKPFLSKRIKLVYRVIDSASYWNPNFFKQLYYRIFVLSGMDGAVGVSEKSLTDMISLHKFKKPAVAIHRAIDPEKFSAIIDREHSRRGLGADNASQIVCLLGNLTKQKRPDRFVNVVKELVAKNPSVRGWIVGDGPLKEEVVQQIKQENLENHIKLWGYQKDVVPYLSASDLLLLPSDTEGLPGVVLEAAFVGVPTVSTEVGGVRECITDGASGYIVPNFDFDLFVLRASELLSDRHLYESFSKEARKRVEEGFTISSVGDKYIDFFKRLISKKI